jgi:RimJ/RimL family protein N-acetyltransferase
MKIFSQTERLMLCYFTEADVDNLFELDSDPEVKRYINGGTPSDRQYICLEVLPSFPKYYEKFNGYGYWSVSEKSSGEFISWLHFRPPLDDSNPQDEIEIQVKFMLALCFPLPSDICSASVLKI